jgi:altronate dehydratase
MISKKTTFLGYRRENGRVGVRNHVIILPVDDISNAACEAVATTSRARWPCRTPTAACSSAPTWTCTSAP